MVRSLNLNKRWGACLWIFFLLCACIDPDHASAFSPTQTTTGDKPSATPTATPKTTLTGSLAASQTSARKWDDNAAKKVSVSRDEWGHRPGPKGFDTVILDAGHGGKDSGAQCPFTGQYEKALTLEIVQLVRNELKDKLPCILTRESDVFFDLDKRVELINAHESAVLISVHFNSGPAALAGPETYYWRVDSYTLAKRLEAALDAAVPKPHSNRGLVRRRLRLTRNPQLPCVLVECGYLSNPLEAANIARPKYKVALAKAIARAVLDQRAEGDGNLGPLPPPIFAPLSRPTDPKE